MSVYDDIVKGLEEAIEYEKGNLKGVRTSLVDIAALPKLNGSQIKTIRMSQHLSQAAFSSVLGVSKKTVEAWESGKNTPSGPAQRMLSLMLQDESFLEDNKIVSRG